MSSLLKEISEILEKNQKSISGISQELRKRGYDSHRLILTGYLRALRDMGILKEVSRPPSKLYSPVSVEELFFSRLESLSDGIDAEDLLPVLILLVNSFLKRECTIGDLRRVGIPQETVRKLVDSDVIEENGGSYVLSHHDLAYYRIAMDIAGEMFSGMVVRY